MRKVALFVEGQTERIFIEKLIENIFTYPSFDIQSYSLRGDRAKMVRACRMDNNLEYFFLIFDVSSDGRLASAIIERAGKLVSEKGYTHIFGIRDIFPNSILDIDHIRSIFDDAICRKGINSETVSLFFAVMEIEAWFLADYACFQKIDSSLTPTYIDNALGIHIQTDDIEAYDHPAVMIDKIFRLIGRRYKKHEEDSFQICSAIDFSELYLNDDVKSRIPSFELFLRKFEKVII